MRHIVSKYGGKCSKCGTEFSQGDTIAYMKWCGTFCVPCEPTDTKEIRYYKQEYANRKADRLEKRASRKDEIADGKKSEFNHLRKDWAWLTQPGHIPGRDKVLNRYDKGIELNIEADNLRDRADSRRRGVQVKGDAARAFQQRRDNIDKLVRVGSRIYYIHFDGEGIVKKIFKNSYRVYFEGLHSGNHEITVEKAFCKFIA